MVELGDHATTHIVPRFKKAINGMDPGGVTEIAEWKGGGCFRFYRLAPSLIETDQFDQKVISKRYNAAMLAEAMCKHMGFTYAPAQDPALYWQQGYSSERDFIYTTTQSLTHDTLKALSLGVGPDRALLICAKAFRARLSEFPNLTVKKIPQAVLANCEWGRDDYSLNIANPPEYGASDEPDEGPDDESNGGDPVLGRRIGPRRAIEADVPTLVSPAHRGPLRMDGTTRAQTQPKMSVLTPVAARPAVPAMSGAKTIKDKPAAKTKPAPKAKSHRCVDDGQGRLL
jgi:hypothetical protein